VFALTLLLPRDVKFSRKLGTVIRSDDELMEAAAVAAAGLVMIEVINTVTAK
jgi:hypothetical protein